MDWSLWLRLTALLAILVAVVFYFLRPKRFGTKPIEQPDNWQGPTGESSD